MFKAQKDKLHSCVVPWLTVFELIRGIKCHLEQAYIQTRPNISAICAFAFVKNKPSLDYGICVKTPLQCFLMPDISSVPSGDLLTFRDCAELLQSGVTDNGVHTIRLPNSTQTVKVVTALWRLSTFSHKYHLTDRDTKYIRHRNPSSSALLSVVMLTHINASRWHLHSFFWEEVSVNTMRANKCDVMLTCRAGGGF